MRLSLILLTSLLLGLFPSCLKTEMVEEPMVQVDTVVLKKPHKPLPPPPIESDDTTDRVSIGWNPTVEDWEETDVDM